MIKTSITCIYMSLGLMLLTACSSQDEVLSSATEEDIIHVGGVSTDGMVANAAVTRAAVAAETLDWLKAGLIQGMDITYLTKTASQKAKLKLEVDGEGNPKTSEGGFTIYSLSAYNDLGQLTTIPAKWLGNGAHTFQGIYIPEGLTKQNTTQDYDDLTHYTAVPPSANIAATVGRITIPLQHRLARVQAYVLIDQSMNTKLKGYDASNHNAVNTQLRFCNVKTLDYVNSDGHPVWQKERKAIPHYLGEFSVKLYKNKSTGNLIFPTDDEWQNANDDYTDKGSNSDYTCTDYGNAPCYDLIVQPTYTVPTTGSNVMYDETVQTAEEKNNIDFELTLDNDLEYEKQFTFDLNANDETVVYLRVSPERIDYKSAGSRLWKESVHHDDYYGVDNQNGNNLSVSGSSWQRAYTNSALNTGVTDGHYYNADDEDLEAQYVSDAKWIEMLLQAYKEGTHHGDYFILKNDIEINTDAYTFPTNFIFTGHLDALDHTITITGTRGYLFDGLDGTYTTTQEEGSTENWEANVHLEGEIWVPTTGWRSETVNVRTANGLLFKDNASINGHVSNCWNATTRINDVTPAIPAYKE